MHTPTQMGSEESQQVGFFTKLRLNLIGQNEWEDIGALDVAAISDLSRLGIEEAWIKTQRLMKDRTDAAYEGASWTALSWGDPTISRTNGHLIMLRPDKYSTNHHQDLEGRQERTGRLVSPLT